MSMTLLKISRLVLTRGLKGQIWNVADDEPAPPQDVVAYAAALLGLPPPPEEPFDQAWLLVGLGNSAPKLHNGAAR